MRPLRAPVVMGLLLLICTTGLCKDSKRIDKSTKDDSILFKRIMEIVRHLEDESSESSAHTQSTSSKESALHQKESHNLKSESGDQIREIFPRDLRKKEKIIRQFTGPLNFDKCRKHVYRLYHQTRDCTIPAYYRRCARLLTRLAGSRTCREG
ncbi:aLK and LTK ligand 2a [Chanos chanos]|uniref:ALK and LTK ligand 2a n=1 Tax=Chanos chanos TaxID=29144 RepID=A0A6J2WFW1_CHACN|nr:ALK and LTK ligand 2-like [Chanos chanos]